MLLGKEALCKEKKIEFILEPDSNLAINENNQFTNDIGTILGNLIENSIDSFKEETKHYKYIKIKIEEDENIIRISVCDNGKKISENIIDKIYDYGFSTKGKHRGVGLHLIQQKLKLYDGSIQLIIENDNKTFKVEVKYEEGTSN